MEQTFIWTQPGREHLELKLVVEDNNIQSLQMKAIGCLNFLTLSQSMKQKLTGPIIDIPLPKGQNHQSLIWQEMILKIKGLWNIPVEHKELCHCRKVDTDVVDKAIVYGAQNVDSIRRRTSANTGCGTCKEDVEKMIHNRLKTS